METLIIHIPDQKSMLVKQLLSELGVTIQQTGNQQIDDYKENLTKVSVWTDEDVKLVENASQAFNDFKTEQW